MGCFNSAVFHDVEQYLKSNNLILIVLFIHYNAPGHVQTLGVHLFEDEVSTKAYFPPIQLLDEGNFQTYMNFLHSLDLLLYFGCK